MFLVKKIHHALFLEFEILVFLHSLLKITPIIPRIEEESFLNSIAL
jgi:hypothetical protein